MRAGSGSLQDVVVPESEPVTRKVSQDLNGTIDEMNEQVQNMLKEKNEAVDRIQEETAKHHELTLQEQTQLNKQISEILLKKDGKNRCLFNPNDQIF